MRLLVFSHDCRHCRIERPGGDSRTSKGRPGMVHGSSSSVGRLKYFNMEWPPAGHIPRWHWTVRDGAILPPPLNSLRYARRYRRHRFIRLPRSKRRMSRSAQKIIFRVKMTSSTSILKPRLRSLQALCSLLASKRNNQSNHTLRVCRELRTYPPSYLLLPPSLFQPCAVSPLFVVGLHRCLVAVAMESFAFAVCGRWLCGQGGIWRFEEFELN